MRIRFVNSMNVAGLFFNGICNCVLSFFLLLTVQFFQIYYNKWCKMFALLSLQYCRYKFFKKSIKVRGHSTTTWTEFCHFLTPPLRGQFLYPKRGQKKTFFDPLPPSSCPRSYWMPPNWIHPNFNLYEYKYFYDYQPPVDRKPINFTWLILSVTVRFLPWKYNVVRSRCTAAPLEHNWKHRLSELL